MNTAAPQTAEDMLLLAQDLDHQGHSQEAALWVQRSADLGHIVAQTQLGLWMIKGRNLPTDSRMGFSLIENSAKGGDALAGHLLVNLYASGTACQQSWDKATSWLIRLAKAGNAAACLTVGALLRPLPRLIPLRHSLYARAAHAGSPAAQYLLGAELCQLQEGPAHKLGLGWIVRAAEAGSRLAGHRLERFAGLPMIRPGADEPGPRIPWQDLKRLLLLPHNAPLPRLTLQHIAPRIWSAAGFLPRHLCDYMIATGEHLLTPATVNDARAGEIVDASRSNSFANFRLLEADLVSLSIDAHISNALEHPFGHGDPLSLLQYEVGQTYAPHYDFFDSAFPAHRPSLDSAGQRTRTALIYLNEDYDGGATRFHEAGIDYRGKSGDLIAFANINAAGEPDHMSLHSGEPPTRGTKWILSKWTREAYLPL